MTIDAGSNPAAHADSFLDRVMQLLSEEIQEKLPGIKKAILETSKKGLTAARKDLMRWNDMLAMGAITVQEYEWLVQARVALIQMDSLRASGLALVRIDEFRHALVRSVVGAALAGIGF